MSSNWHEVIDQEGGRILNRIDVCPTCWPNHTETTRKIGLSARVEVKELATVPIEAACHYCGHESEAA